jgi:dTDP-4-dehydrorhamnose 3,5-epimerase
MNSGLIIRNEVALRRVETALPGVCLVRPKVLHDIRGFFLESYHQANLADLGISDHFVQDNHSRSIKGTLRGLHYQLHHPQAKLCWVVEGEVLDIVVDIRLGSPSFGKWIYVPTGFAHGFVVLSESAQFLYKCSDFYDPEDERGIAWNDPDLNISWDIANPLLSEKDQHYLPLAQIPRQFLPQYHAQ